MQVFLPALTWRKKLALVVMARLVSQDRIFISVVILNPLLAYSDAFPGLVNAWEMIALGWDEVNVLVRT